MVSRWKACFFFQAWESSCKCLGLLPGGMFPWSMSTVCWGFKSSLSRRETHAIQCFFCLFALMSHLAEPLGCGASPWLKISGAERKTCLLSCSGWAAFRLDGVCPGWGWFHVSKCNRQSSDLLVPGTFSFAHRFCGSGLRQGTVVSTASGVLSGKSWTANCLQTYIGKFYFAHRFCGSGLRQGTMVSVASVILVGKSWTPGGSIWRLFTHVLGVVGSAGGWAQPGLVAGMWSLRVAWASSQHDGPRGPRGHRGS